LAGGGSGAGLAFTFAVFAVAFFFGAAAVFLVFRARAVFFVADCFAVACVMVPVGGYVLLELL